MAQLFTTPYQTTLDANANAVSGARLFFYVTGTNTPAPVYADAALTTPLPAPVVADAAGRFVPIYLDPAVQYRVVVADAGGTPIRDVDPLGDSVIADLANGEGLALVGFQQAGAGAVPRTALAKAREVLSAPDFGATGNGTADDTAPLLSAAIAARTGLTDGTGRMFAGEVHLPPGKYRITGPIDLAAIAGVTGLTISGSGGTQIIFDGPTATLRCSSSRAVTFRDVAFVSAGIDTNQVAFTVNYSGNPLRSWNFERCDFAAFYQCFKVTGASLCSEFFFDKCGFLQCYHLMNNDNDQAVNWNFVNCNWENEALDTTKDRNLASQFFLQAGTLANWTGGSMVLQGSMVYFNLTSPNKVQSTSHAITYDGVRIELVDGGAGSHVPLINRVEAGYAAGNAPVVGFRNCTIINRGAIPPTTIYAKLWNNCDFSFENCQMEGGRVVGILDGLTTSQNGTLRIINTSRLDYFEDTSNRAGDHDAHAVHIVPPFNGAEGALIADVRPSNLGAPASVQAKFVSVRGPTGSLPLAGTSVALRSLPIHSLSMRLFIHSYDVPGNSLTMELRDQADTTTYGTVTLAAGSKIAWADAPGEIGFQIPAVPLMLKFTGTPQVLKGVCGWEYL